MWTSQARRLTAILLCTLNLEVLHVLGAYRLPSQDHALEASTSGSAFERVDVHENINLVPMETAWTYITLENHARLAKLINSPNPTPSPETHDFGYRPSAHKMKAKNKSTLLPLEDLETGANTACPLCKLVFEPPVGKSGTPIWSVTEITRFELEGCRHHFHRGCISLWLKLENRCPKCRQDEGGECPNSPGIVGRLPFEEYLLQCMMYLQQGMEIKATVPV